MVVIIIIIIFSNYNREMNYRGPEKVEPFEIKNLT